MKSVLLKGSGIFIFETDSQIVFGGFSMYDIY
jgi:hypothetical protein